MHPRNQNIPGFAAAVVRWQKSAGRRNLPWQNLRDPYKIWLAETMLQQTQVAAVVPFYRRFVARFPNVDALADAPQAQVLAAWSGLGYYARARNLHRAARMIRADGFPQSADEWRGVPGVGRSTAAAISAFAFGERRAILDGNVKRVVARVAAFRKPVDSPQASSDLWATAEALVPKRADIRGYTQGMMDLGATICLPRAPRCDECPVRKWCRARALNIAGQLPAKTKKAPRKVREVVATVIHSGGKILLERRPPSGIWGGLLSPPEGDVSECESRFGLSLSSPSPLPPIVHDFTHFRMTMRLMLAKAKRGGRLANIANCEWAGASDLNSAPLPSPIKKAAPDWIQLAAKRSRTRIRKQQPRK